MGQRVGDAAVSGEPYASEVTGEMHVRSLWGDSSTILLRDFAQPVKVLDRQSPFSITTFLSASGMWMKTFLCCGPDAPLPNWYREDSVRQRLDGESDNEGPIWEFSYQQRDAGGQIHTRVYRATVEVVELSSIDVREMLRNQYAVMANTDVSWRDWGVHSPWPFPLEWRDGA